MKDCNADAIPKNIFKLFIRLNCIILTYSHTYLYCMYVHMHVPTFEYL